MKMLDELKGKLHKMWWIPMITGILAIGLGIWCFASPVTSIPVFAYTFSILIIFAGVLNLVYAGVNARLRTNWGWSLALGLLEIACGVWMLTLSPAMLSIAFVYAIGIYLVIAAINAVCEAMYFSRYSTGWSVVMVLLLVATIIMSFYIIANPISGSFAGWLWLGTSLLLFGIWRIGLALKVRSINNAIAKF